MPIFHFDYKLSPGLQQEMEQACKGYNADTWKEKIDNLKSPHDYYNNSLSDCYFQEIIHTVNKRDHKLKILDIGVGSGESSVMLAHQGHKVSVVEPLPINCQIMDRVTKKVGINLDIYCLPAEEMNCITDNKFDLCIFNASFHHCDSPEATLHNCFNLLRPGGEVLFINEPILKFYRTKKWYNRQLEVNPVKMGHYGGNEHIYSIPEYIRYLKKSGLTAVKTEPSKYLTDVRSLVSRKASLKIDEQAVYSEGRLFIHHFLHLLLAWSIKTPVLVKIFTRLSLLSVTISATKPHAATSQNK